jgi:hypothetical protein
MDIAATEKDLAGRDADHGTVRERIGDDRQCVVVHALVEQWDEDASHPCGPTVSRAAGRHTRLAGWRVWLVGGDRASGFVCEGWLLAVAAGVDVVVV